MDPITHGLASYALRQAAFPRLSVTATLMVVAAGMVADLDALSRYFGPSAFLRFDHALLHSLVAALAIALLAALPFWRQKTLPKEKETARGAIFRAALAAAILHLVLDTFQSAGVKPLWPFRSAAVAKDWVGRFDLWIPGILLVGILLPQLAAMVSEEIGAKSKRPRGQIGATTALLVVILYLGIRGILHGNAVTALDSHTYHGESPRKVAAFADANSPLRWHGVVETESALHAAEVELGPGARFDPESAATAYKPESSAALNAARDTPSARRLLAAARFPKATVEGTTTGFHVTLREHASASGAPVTQVEALVETDPVGKVVSQELAWIPQGAGRKD